MLLFIFYFIVDNAGYKMARDGKVEVWEGIWLSSAVLLPLGVFFTYKAVGDSAVFNFDAYTALFRRLTGREQPRTLELKEMIMTEVEPSTALEMLIRQSGQEQAASAALDAMPKWRRFATSRTAVLDAGMNSLVDYLSNSRDARVINLLNKYPFRATPGRLAGIMENTRNLIQIFNDKA